MRMGPALGWLLGLFALVLALHVMGHGPLAPPPLTSLERSRAWLAQRDTATAVFAALRLGASVVAWYLLGATLLGCAARMARSRRLVRWTDMATLPFLRRVLTSVAGVSLTASTASLIALPMLGPGTPLAQRAAATAPAPPGDAGRTDPQDVPPGTTSTTVVMRRIPPPSDDTTATMEVIADPPTTPSTRPTQSAQQPPVPAPVERPPPVAPPTSSVTAEAGASLWSLADDALLHAWHRPPTDEEVAPYWRLLIEHNRSRLVDAANPDLIYPGQSFVLPPPPPTP